MDDNQQSLQSYEDNDNVLFCLDSAEVRDRDTSAFLDNFGRTISARSGIVLKFSVTKMMTTKCPPRTERCAATLLTKGCGRKSTASRVRVLNARRA